MLVAATKRLIKLLFVAAIAVVFLLFSIANRQAVSINLAPLAYTLQMPEFLFAILCFILGALLGGMMISFGSWKIGRKLRAAQRRLMALENEVAAKMRS